FRQGVRYQAGLIRLLDVGVSFERQARPEFGQQVEDLVEGHRVQVGHIRRAAQWERVRMLDWIHCLEIVLEPAGERHQIIGDQLTADEQRHGECGHGWNSRKKSMASLWTSCVAAQEILSSWASFFSLKRMMLCSSARLVRPHGHGVSQSMVTSSP